MLLMVLKYNLVALLYINASLVLFEVNGTSLSQGNIIAKSFMELDLEENDNTGQR